MTQPQYVESTPTPVEKASVWEDFMDIFYAPAQVFRRRIDGNWFVPMLVVTLSITVITFLTYGALRPVYDAEFDRSIQATMRANPQLTPDMMETGRKVAEFTGKYGMIIIYPILIFVVGLLLWLVGKMFGSKQSFQSALMVSGYAQVPRVLGAVAMGVQALFLDPSKVTGLQSIAIGPARFVSADAVPTIVYALLMRLDIFTIWATILLAVGLHVTGKISKGSAAMAAGIVWLCGLLPMLRQAAAARTI